MNSVVFTISYHQLNTQKVDFTMNLAHCMVLGSCFAHTSHLNRDVLIGCVAPGIWPSLGGGCAGLCRGCAAQFLDTQFFRYIIVCISIYIYQYIYNIPIYQYIYQSACQYINISIYEFINISLYQYITISIYIYINIYIYTNI